MQAFINKRGKVDTYVDIFNVQVDDLGCLRQSDFVPRSTAVSHAQESHRHPRWYLQAAIWPKPCACRATRNSLVPVSRLRLKCSRRCAWDSSSADVRALATSSGIKSISTSFENMSSTKGSWTWQWQVYTSLNQTTNRHMISVESNQDNRGGIPIKCPSLDFIKPFRGKFTNLIAFLGRVSKRAQSTSLVQRAGNRLAISCPQCPPLLGGWDNGRLSRRSRYQATSITAACVCRVGSRRVTALEALAALVAGSRVVGKTVTDCNAFIGYGSASCWREACYANRDAQRCLQEEQ